MKDIQVYKDLDTSFVNLSALIKYLRRRRFAGNIRVELGNYEADIILTSENEMRVREHDSIAGRVAEGDDALERLLIRARESGGIINVYQASDEQKENGGGENFAAASQYEQSAVGANLFKNKSGTNGGDKSGFEENPVKPKINAPHFPFEFINQVENRSGKSEVSAEDWQTLMDLTGELLSTIDESLAEANLIFPSAFEKARIEVSDDYPFLSPISGIFTYRSGKVLMDEQVNAAQFVAGINETLRRILGKLGQNPKFPEVYRLIVQKILALIHTRKTLYDKFAVTPQLEKILGA